MLTVVNRTQPSSHPGAQPTSTNVAPQPPTQQHASASPDDRIRALIQQTRSNPQAMEQIRRSHPALYDAVLAGNVEQVSRFVASEQSGQEGMNRRQAELMSRIARDPMDMEAQRMLEEEIRMRNVVENMENAMENHPESFATVSMLYIPLVINGVTVKAFVDCGAQATFLSAECAERCGVMRLVDSRFAGIAKGVGESKILGRVHVYQIKIGQSFFPVSFSILENGGMDMLLGLDMLRRFQCSVDLRANVLRIGEEAIAFLSEGEIGSTASSDLAPVPAQQPLPVANNPSQAAQNPPPQGAPQDSEWQSKIAQLTGLGFPVQQCEAALRSTDGNVEMAAGLLFEM
mgnify:CR=1 FL=1|jgi:DNA damage-inducible protein 1